MVRRRRTQRREFAILAMVGILCDPSQPPLPPFPPLPLEDETPDEEQLREVTEEMNLDRPAGSGSARKRPSWWPATTSVGCRGR